MSNSNLSDIGINLKYIKGLPLDYFRYNGYPHPSSYAMTWCMVATGVYRIFNRDDMKEFLFRLPITLNSLGLVETWLMKDHLMDYRVKNKEYTLTLNEVSMHFGLEIADVIENKSSREQFLERISAGITGSMIMGEFGGFSVIEPEINEDDTKTFSGQMSTPAIIPELISKAEFFAADLLKFIPEETFSDVNPLIAEKEKENKLRRENKKKQPVFGIRKIPHMVVYSWVREAFNPEYAKKLHDDKELFNKVAKPLIYLAWLMAHDLIIRQGIYTCEAEGVDLNYDDYMLPGGGYNLEETIEEFRLEDLSGSIMMYCLDPKKPFYIREKDR